MWIHNFSTHILQVLLVTTASILLPVVCDGENGQGTMDTIVNDYVRRGGADCAEYCEVTCHNIYENQNICASNEHSVSVVVKIVGFSPQSNGVNFFLTQSAFYSIAQPDYGTISVVSEEYVWVIFIILSCYFWWNLQGHFPYMTDLGKAQYYYTSSYHELFIPSMKIYLKTGCTISYWRRYPLKFWNKLLLLTKITNTK